MNFCDALIARARERRCRVLLPESQDVRVLAAAARAQQTEVADCLLTGDESAIKKTAAAHGIALPPGLTFLSPAPDDYIAPLTALRAARNKTMDEKSARALLQNPVALAAMLLHDGSADALVAGAVTTSADVLRPALQIIGLAPGAALASSAFLMCFDDGMKVFADCALNISPDAAQLAAIAAQSAATAAAFGLRPVIAMLSYASGASGSGSQVEQVKTATALLKQQLPAAAIAGPIQYDAAVCADIAALKMPDDAAAGRANVLIFPDLQAGNIGYKAVQQAAGIVSIGPLLQGLAAPVNDLSRGAGADDIYYTIAATVMQAAALSAA